MESIDQEARKRREWEDTLLNTRTGIFLILNGFALQPDSVDIFVAFAIAIINLFWVLASIQSLILIKDLTTKSEKTGAQLLVSESLGNRKIHHMFRPTTIIGQWVPVSVYIGWVIYVSLQIDYMVSVLIPCFGLLPIIAVIALQKLKNA